MRRSTNRHSAAARTRGAVRAGRRPRRRGRRHRHRRSRSARTRAAKADTHNEVNIELGATANPPGFDAQLLGLEAGRDEDVHDSLSRRLRGRGARRAPRSTYTVTVKSIKRRVLPELDDEFAKDLGEFETLDALRARVREDLEHEARHAAEREVASDLMKQLAARVPFDVPAVARRPRNRPASRGLRAAPDGAEREPARRRTSTGTRSARASATRRAKRSRRRSCSTKWRGASTST